MNIKKLITYGFEVKLIQENKNIFNWEFYVLAKSQTKAKRILEEYLSNPNKTGLKYKILDSINPLPSNDIIIDLDMDLEILNEYE